MMTPRLRRTAAGIVIGIALTALVGCAGSSAGAPSVAPTPTPVLLWSDEFDGPAGTLPDPTKWGFETGGSGWGNNELECYTSVPGNASLDGNGNLAITAIRQPGHVCVDGAITDYTSARVTTENRFSTTHGRLEVRAKVPTASGTWPAFWALGVDKPTVGWPAAGEIDVMEVVGRQPSTVHGAVHGPDTDGSHVSTARELDTRADLSSSFHVFAADWSSDAIVFSMDGVSYGTITRAEVEATGVWVYDHSFYLLLNLAVGGDFPGDPDASTVWPQQYLIDFVRVYD